MQHNEILQLAREASDQYIKISIDEGVLVPVKSFDEYRFAIQEAKESAAHKLFTNSYMMRAEVERLIRLNLLFRLKIKNGVAFVENQQSYWRAHLHIDLEKKLQIPKLEKSILVEMVYLNGKQTEEQGRFLSFFRREEYSHFYETYLQIDSIPKISQKEFVSHYEILMGLLAKENVSICIPDDEQLKQIEEIYHQQIDMYTQTFFTVEERMQQRDQGLITCLADQNGEVRAISFSPKIGGGAIAVKEEYTSNIYAVSLMVDGLKGFYSDDDKNSADKKARPRRNYPGYVATRNKASRRLHEKFGISYTGKAFDQFVIPGFMY